MINLNYTSFLAIFLIVFGCSQGKQSSPLSQQDISKESKRANDHFEEYFNDNVSRKPELQTELGIKTDYDKWNDISDEMAQIELKIAKDALKWIQDSIQYDLLDDQTQLSYELFKYELEETIKNDEFRLYNYPVNQMFGRHTIVVSLLINQHRIDSLSDAHAYIKRLINIKPLFDQLITNLKAREANGIVPPDFVFPKVISSCQNLISGKPFDKSDTNSPLLGDFMKKVAGLDGASDEAKNDLVAKAEEALISIVGPSYENLISFLEQQQKGAVSDAGAWKFPNGEAFFAHALKNTTTTELTSEEIHQIGLSEVERIHGEMQEIMKSVNFSGSLQDFFQFMKTDQQFYYPNTDEGKEEYMAEAKVLIDDMKSRLDELFIVKPKADMIVKRVEAFREKAAGKAFYERPAPDGSRPGIYYANLYNSTDMPKYEMAALAYHEGIPGHHMQLAIAQELEGIPKFRKYGGYTAYIEGWGLYSELIPKEIDLYEDPYSDFGRLAMELWRACRLVVDTGIHSKKWTREEGIAFYRNNTSGSDRDCERMVERHIVMPSQATAYKIGMLKILELRKKAKKDLGEKFDIRKFHEVVLKNGALPLPILEKLVNEWVTLELKKG
ncbi:MAG: DUF885 domain-containing protein [Cyclobacteriaceae bacterium]